MILKGIVVILIKDKLLLKGLIEQLENDEKPVLEKGNANWVDEL